MLRNLGFVEDKEVDKAKIKMKCDLGYQRYNHFKKIMKCTCTEEVNCYKQQ